jgi:vacuolar-type H+-ATPase subunit I/STV1
MRRFLLVVTIVLVAHAAAGAVDAPASSGAPPVGGNPSSAPPAGGKPSSGSATSAAPGGASALASWTQAALNNATIDFAAGTETLKAMVKAVQAKAAEVKSLREVLDLVEAQRAAVVKQAAAKRAELGQLRSISEPSGAEKARMAQLEAEIAKLETTEATLKSNADSVRDRIDRALADIAAMETAIENAEAAIQRRMASGSARTDKRASKDETKDGAAFLDLARRTKADVRALRTSIVSTPLTVPTTRVSPPPPVSSSKATTKGN